MDPGGTDVAMTDEAILERDEGAATSAVMPMPADPTSQPDAATTKLTAFSWPARGRITSGFGKRADGTTSNGLHIAVRQAHQFTQQQAAQ
ncbi:MAG: hypothetical protein AcusKO_42550 [Acuticoccus sp.]